MNRKKRPHEAIRDNKPFFPLETGWQFGSLDRSWARRARFGSASKKRPELQNIDFGADRERPISPAPIAVETMKRAASEEVTRPRFVFHPIRRHFHHSHFTNNDFDNFDNIGFGQKLIVI